MKTILAMILGVSIPLLFLWYIVYKTDDLPNTHSDFCNCHIISQYIDYDTFDEVRLVTHVWFDGDIVHSSYKAIINDSVKTVELGKAKRWVTLMENNQ